MEKKHTKNIEIKDDDDVTDEDAEDLEVPVIAPRAIRGNHGAGFSGGGREDVLGRGRGRVGGRGRGKQLASEVPAPPAAPRAIRGRRAFPIIAPVIAPEVVIRGRGGRGRGKQIASEASVAVAQASVAQVESPAPAEVVQLRRGRSIQTQQ